MLNRMPEEGQQMINQENLLRDLFVQVALTKDTQAVVHLRPNCEPWCVFIRPWRVEMVGTDADNPLL
jgi:hypothetical protein